MNLRAMATMRAAFGVPVGLSDHTTGIAVPAGGRRARRGAGREALHARPLDGGPRPPVRARARRAAARWSQGVREVEAALGDGRLEGPSEAESGEMYRLARRSVVAAVGHPGGHRDHARDAHGEAPRLRDHAEGPRPSGRPRRARRHRGRRRRSPGRWSSRRGAGQGRGRDASSVVRSSSEVVTTRPQLEAITDLARDRRLITPELHMQNAYYGHATVLKTFAGIPQWRPLKVAIEHGVAIVPQVWTVDAETAMPVFLCASEERARTYSALFHGTEAVAIGPMIEYAEPLCDPKSGWGTAGRLSGPFDAPHHRAVGSHGLRKPAPT